MKIKPPTLISILYLIACLSIVQMLENKDRIQHDSEHTFLAVENNIITFKTGRLMVQFDIVKKGALIGIKNVITGQFFQFEPSKANYLWMVDAHGIWFSSYDTEFFNYSISNSSIPSKLFMHWKIGLVNVSVVVEDDMSYGLKMHINFTNNDSNLLLRRVFFPFIGGIKQIGNNSVDDSIAIPEREGYIIEEARDSLIEHPLGLTYPGTMSMQFVLFYEKNCGGFYFGVHDADSNFKGIELLPDSETSIKFNWFHFANNISYGNNFVMNYNVVLDGFSSRSWEKGAMLYKKWALNQWYLEKGSLKERTDVPEWLKEIDVVWKGSSYSTDHSTGEIILEGETVDKMPSFASEVKNLLPNADILLEWWGWNRDGFDRSYPEYYPPRDGSDVLKNGINGTHEEGVKVMLYFNGRLVDVTTSTFEMNKQYMTVNENGEYYTETYHPYFTAAVACPATEWWKSIVINFSIIAVRDYGADIVFLDQISVAAPKLCYSTEHGHPPGGGSWWWKEENELLQRVRTEIRKHNSNAAIASENVNEVFIKSIDAFWSYDTHYDFVSWLPKGRSAPLFSFVYHRYVLQYGRPDVAPYASPRWGSDMYYWTVSENLARGYVVGVSTLRKPSRAGVMPSDVTFLLDAIKTRRTFNEYLSYGEMVTSPIIQMNNHTFTDEYGWGRNATRPIAAVGVYKNGRGNVLILLSNRVWNAQIVKITLNFSELGINSPRVLITKHRDGDVSWFESKVYSDGDTLSVEIDGFSNIVLIIIRTHFSLVTLNKVHLDLDEEFYEGSDLVVGFYDYHNRQEANTTIWSGAIPTNVTLSVDISHPSNKNVENVTLLLTDNSGGIIRTVSSFIVTRSILMQRVSEIDLQWVYVSEEERSVLFTELVDMDGQWPYAPP